MLKLLMVFLGGGCGASMRYGAGVLVARLTPEDVQTPHWLAMYPVATMTVNLLGCALIGLAWGLMGDPKEGNEALRLALVVGVLGGFTTFSAFSLETLALLDSARTAAAGGYVAASVLGCVAAAWLGQLLGAEYL